MRDWIFLDRFYQELLDDIYPQPDEQGRIDITKEVINRFPEIQAVTSVLDVGCGEGYLADLLSDQVSYCGVTLSQQDFDRAISLKRNVILDDFNFLNGIHAELVFASHALEHSPIPLLTLMEWHQVSTKYLCLISPNPDYYTYIGRNHYSVFNHQHLRWLLRRSGWLVIKEYITATDIAFLCQKMDRISYEGWASIPLPYEIYELDRGVGG
jgi:SAM-dependent methyltransferase